MGTFFVDVLVAASLTPVRREPAKLLVDTGSLYTWISEVSLRALGVTAADRRRIVTIDGSVSERDAGEILITLEGRTLHTLCLFGRESCTARPHRAPPPWWAPARASRRSVARGRSRGR